MKNKKILCLTYDQMGFSVLQWALECLPFTLIRETSTSDALEMMRYIKFDLVITNFTLKIIDGSNLNVFPFIGCLKEKYPKIKTLLLNEYNDHETEQLISEVGFDQVISIPFERLKLREVVIKLFNIPILFITANSFNARLVCSNPKSIFHSFIFEESVSQSLEILSQGNVDTVIVDINLPAPGRSKEMKAKPLIEKIQAEFPNVKIIIALDTLLPKYQDDFIEFGESLGVNTFFDMNKADLQVL